MGWIWVVGCIPIFTPLVIELMLPLVYRLLARMLTRKPAALGSSTDGPYRDSPAPIVSPEPPSYFSAWDRYRRARLSCGVVWLSFPIVLALMIPVGGWFAENPVAAALITLGWIGSLIFSALRWELFRCPRCKDHFRAPSAPVEGQNAWPTFPRLCQKCTLRIYAPRNPLDEADECTGVGPP